MIILGIACSGRAAESYKVSQKIAGFLLQAEPTALVVAWVIGGSTISHIDEDYATAPWRYTTVACRDVPHGSMCQSEELIQELESADFVVIGAPMHNFRVPSSRKACRSCGSSASDV